MFVGVSPDQKSAYLSSFAFIPVHQVWRLYCKITVGLWSNLFRQDFLGPAQCRVGSRETDGCEGEDDGMHDLRLRYSDAEQLAHMRTYAALRLCAHGDTKLD